MNSTRWHVMYYSKNASQLGLRIRPLNGKKSVLSNEVSLGDQIQLIVPMNGPDNESWRAKTLTHSFDDRAFVKQPVTTARVTSKMFPVTSPVGRHTSSASWSRVDVVVWPESASDEIGTVCMTYASGVALAPPSAQLFGCGYSLVFFDLYRPLW